MASPCGTSSGSTSLLQNSGSEENLQQLMDQRKRKRMISNRESARRSRMKKQKHLDDLTAQIVQLRNENNQIITSISVTTQQYMNVESENSILRAQMAELSHRLESTNEIISFLNVTTDGYFATGQEPYSTAIGSSDELMNGSCNCLYLNQPIMAFVDMSQY